MIVDFLKGRTRGVRGLSDGVSLIEKFHDCRKHFWSFTFGRRILSPWCYLTIQKGNYVLWEFMKHSKNSAYRTLACRFSFMDLNHVACGSGLFIEQHAHRLSNMHSLASCAVANDSAGGVHDTSTKMVPWLSQFICVGKLLFNAHITHVEDREDTRDGASDPPVCWPQNLELANPVALSHRTWTGDQ